MNEPQNMVALAKATKIRLARAASKRDLREGRITLSEVLEQEHMQSMVVFDLLCAQCRWGKIRARKAFRQMAELLGMTFPLPEGKTVGSLTDRQKRALLQACGYDVVWREGIPMTPDKRRILDRLAFYAHEVGEPVSSMVLAVVCGFGSRGMGSRLSALERSGYVSRRAYGWEITDRGREVLADA